MLVMMCWENLLFERNVTVCVRGVYGCLGGIFDQRVGVTSDLKNSNVIVVVAIVGVVDNPLGGNPTA